MRIPVTLVIGILTWPLSFPRVASAQGTAGEEGSSGFSIALFATKAGGGPSDDLAEAFEEMGFGDRSGRDCFFGLCSGPSDYPISFGKEGFGLELAYEFSSAWGVVMNAGRAEFGEVIGNSNDTGTISFQSSARHLSLSASKRFRRLRTTFGPSLIHSRTILDPSFSYPRIIRDKVLIGVDLGLSFTIPLWRSFSAEARANGRLFWRDEYGPYDWSWESGGYLGEEPEVRTVTLPTTSVWFSHWELALGVGYHVGD